MTLAFCIVNDDDSFVRVAAAQAIGTIASCSEAPSQDFQFVTELARSAINAAANSLQEICEQHCEQRPNSLQEICEQRAISCNEASGYGRLLCKAYGFDLEESCQCDVFGQANVLRMLPTSSN